MIPQRIREALDELDDKVERARSSGPQDLDRPLVCDGVGAVGRCTDTSVWLADRLGGVVYGYAHAENPDAELGREEFGHDFTLVDGRWLVDWWARDTYQHRDAYDLMNEEDLAIVRHLYGDPDLWRPMDAQAFSLYLRYIRSLRA